jgi:NAD(P)-dependent dehydrogenase (short-subunit alcohol dehydrogenase family)
MNDDVKGKVAIVTGAGRGIGRGIALAYGAAGIKVAVVSRTQKTVDGVTEEIRKAGGTALGVTCNVGDREAVFAMVDRVARQLGRVDILVNNAQGHGPADNPAAAPVLQPLENFDESEWEHSFRTGVTASLWSMKAVFPHMKDRGGRIVNFGSAWGQLGNQGSAAYNANKEAIRGLTRTAAREWGKYRITCNVISPVVRTDAMMAVETAAPEHTAEALRHIPLGRWGDPVKDGGGLALFLASSQSDFLTGMTFMLDGGFCMYP